MKVIKDIEVSSKWEAMRFNSVFNYPHNSER